MRTFPLTGYIALLFAALALTVVMFAGLLFWQLRQNEQAALERRIVRQAQSIATAIESSLQEMSSAAKLVSLMPDMSQANFEDLHRRTRKALAGTGNYVLLVDRTGQQLLNTRRPYSETLPKTSNLRALDVALATRKPVLSNVFMGSTSGRLVFNYILPLSGVSGTVAAVIVTRNAKDLTSAINSHISARGWSAGVIDSSGAVVAAKGERMTDGKLVADLAEFKPRAANGLIVPGPAAPMLDAGSIGGYASIRDSRWLSVTFGPRAGAQVSVLESWPLLFGGGLLIFFFGATVFVLMTRDLKTSISGIAGMAKEMSQGGVVSPINSRILEVDSVAKALSVASFDRSEAEDRLNFVMRELAHRTKNLMTVISSMVRQTARENASVKDMQQVLTSRIQSLGYSIDLLTAKNWVGVSLKELAARHIKIFTDAGEQIVFEGDELQLKPEAVQNLGMAFHELATNSVKYGALSRPNGSVHIRWFISDNENDDQSQHLNLQWLEYGGPAVQKPTTSGFGTQVITSHTEVAFSGKVDVDYGEKGFSWNLRAPVECLVQD